MFRKKYNDRSETWSKESLEKQSLDIRYIDFTSTLQLRERKTIVLFVNDLSTRWRYPQFFHSHAKKVVMPRIKKMSTNEREVLFSISKMQSYRNLFELLSFFWRGFSFFLIERILPSNPSNLNSRFSDNTKPSSHKWKRDQI